MKENDWIVAGLLNPDKNTFDLLAGGLSVNNTLFLSADTYKSSPFVLLQFSKNGNFDEVAFDLYYKKKATEFKDFSKMTAEDTYIYSPFDPRARKGDKKVRDVSLGVSIVPNYNKETTTITGLVFSSPMSDRERALLNRIWDVTTKTWSEDTLNDRSFFKNPAKWFEHTFSNPLVYATYDEEGTHWDPFVGGMVQHKKGQYKLDKFGNPYTETLGGRSIIGKDVVSGTDIITVDGVGIDKYNFLDSDDLDKSVTGTVMKTVAAIAPMLIPGVNNIYSGYLVSREMLKTLPMLYGFASAWFDTPEDIPTLNRLAGIGNALTTSTSDYARSSIFNAEGLFSMISDVALQYGQLLFVAKSLTGLRGGKTLTNLALLKAFDLYRNKAVSLELKAAAAGEKELEAARQYIGTVEKWHESALGKAALDKYMKPIEPIVQRMNRMGADASLAYMALVSNTDVYATMLEHGATRKEAAAVALGSTIGMFGVDRYFGLGELFFDDLTSSYEKSLRRTFKKAADDWGESMLKGASLEASGLSGSKIRRLVQKGINLGRNKTLQWVEDLKYHTTGFWGKAFGEGIEEVSEEIVTDVSKGIYEIMGDLGFDTSVKKVGAFEDLLPRYGMSFLGGTIGGGLFYGVHVYLNGKFHVDTTQDELIYHIRNGKTKEILETLDEWRDAGKLGSTSLSMKKTKDSDGNDVFLTAESAEDSQNEFVYNRIKETVLSLDHIIHENRANLSEDELFENMVLSDVRFLQLNSFINTLNMSYLTRYLLDYQDAVSKIANLEGQWQRANLTTTGLAYDTDEELAKYVATDEKLRHMSLEEKDRRSKNLKKLEEAIKVAKEDLLKFNNGEYSLYYTEKMLVALDEAIHKDWIALSFDLWLKKEHNKTVDLLSPAELESYKEKYFIYKSKKAPLIYDDKFSLYFSLKEKINPALLLIQEGEENFAKFLLKILPLLSLESPLLNIKLYSLNDVLDFDGETEESVSYLNRELPEYKILRELKVLNENKRLVEEAKDKALKIIKSAGGFIDPLTRRNIKLLFRARSKDAVKGIRENMQLDMKRAHGGLTDLDISILNLLENIDPNKLDKDGKIWDLIEEMVRDHYTTPIIKLNKRLNHLLSYVSGTTFGKYLDPEWLDSFSGTELSSVIENHLNDGFTLDEIFDTSNDKMWNAIDEKTEEGRALKLSLVGFLTDIRTAYDRGSLNDYSWVSKSPDDALNSNLEYNDDLLGYNNLYRDFLLELRSNPIVNLNLELDAVVTRINPVLELVKSLGLVMNADMGNLERILTDLDTRFEEADQISEIILSKEEKESLQEAFHLLELTLSFLATATRTHNFVSPFGHNHVLNEMAELHKDIYKNWKKLPELSADVASMYYFELERYKYQIGINTDGRYNLGSWLELSQRNEGNTELLLLDAEKRWTKACYDIFAGNAEHFLFEFNDKSYDLLEGIESIPPITENTKESLVYLNRLFNLFHSNVLKLIKEGWSYTDIFDRSLIFLKITNINKILDLKTCTIDEDVSVESLTDYDKVIIIATAGAMDSTSFNAYLKLRVTEEHNIVPLTILEWLTRVGVAFTENTQIFREALEYIKHETSDSRPIILGTFINGNAGAGKSSVIGKNIASYTEGDDIWLSAPKESLLITLFDSIGKGKKFLNLENPKAILEPYPLLIENLGIDVQVYHDAIKLLNDEKTRKAVINKENISNDYFNFTYTKDASVLTINNAKFGIKKVDNAPKVIIIDEATHLDAIAIQLISTFAEMNDVKLYFLGDTKQRGCELLGFNLDREQVITVRTPNLGISLRTNNVLHYRNLKSLETLIIRLSNLDYSEETRDKYLAEVNDIKASLKNIKFKVYKLTDINGDLLTTTLDSNTINKIKGGSVGYVGVAGPALDALRAAGVEPIVMLQTDVQGLEFDYIVVEKDFNIPNRETNGTNLLSFLLDLYTMCSRGRKGSIIVDPSHELRVAIGENIVENIKADTPKISEYAERFRKSKIDVLDQILGSSKSKLEESKKVKGTEDEDEDTDEEEDSGEEGPESRVVLNKDFNVDELDFSENIYVTYTTTMDKVEDILKDGLSPEGGLNNSARIVTLELLKSDIARMVTDVNHDNDTAIVLMEFPKSEFVQENRKVNLKNIANILEELGNDIGVVPEGYIKNVINVLRDTGGFDEITRPEDEEAAPELNPKVLSELLSFEGEIPLGTEDIYGNPILAYGEATFTGFKVEKRRGRHVWINPPIDKDTRIRRDLQIFTDKSEITANSELVSLSEKIYAFKSKFLFRKPYSSLDEDIRTKIISEEDYNNMRWFVEVREVNDLDNFIRNISFKENKSVLTEEGEETVDSRTITSKKLIFSVVGEFKMKNGDVGHITLGLLSDPDNWINRVPSIIKSAEDTIAKLEEAQRKAMDDESKRKQILVEIDHLKLKIESLDLSKRDTAVPLLYKEYMEELASRYDPNTKKSVIVDNFRLIFPGITDLHDSEGIVPLSRVSKLLIRDTKKRIETLRKRYDEAVGDDLKRARLAYKIEKAKAKLKEFEEIEDYSFRSLNPYILISPMYIYAPETKGKHAIDDSVIGKYNVIFVSSDPDLSGSDLMAKYMALKLLTADELKTKGFINFMSGDSVMPSVRMIPLYNLGVSFQDLSNPYLLEAMSSEVSYTRKNGELVHHEQIYPFKTNYTGARMYVSMWNFRANITRFGVELNKFLDDPLIKSIDLDTYLAVKDIKWRLENSKKGGKKPSKHELEYLAKHLNLPNFDQVSERIDKFNDSLAGKVKQFRLGSSLENGAYIRLLTGNLKAFYNGYDRVNGVYLDTATFTKYKGLIDDLFTHVLDHIIKCNYNRDLLISLENGTKNSLAGSYSSMFTNNGKIKIHDPYSNKKDISIEFNSAFNPSKSSGIGNSFSHIPAILSKVFKFTTMALQHPGKNWINGLDIILEYTKSDEEGGNEEKVSVEIPYTGIWDNLEMNDHIADSNDTSIIPDLVFDSTLSDFFSFMFHGTLENIHGEGVLRASDALFPKGFFADPLSTLETNPGEKMFIKSVQLLIFFGLKKRVGLPTFFLDLNSFKLSVEDSRVPTTKPPLDTNDGMLLSVTIIQNVKAKYPKLADDLDAILEDLEDVSDDLRIARTRMAIGTILEAEVNANFNSIFSGSVPDIDITALVKLVSDTEAMTFAEYIASEYKKEFGKNIGLNMVPLVDNSSEISTIIVNSGDTSLKITRNGDNIVIKEIETEVADDSELIGIVNNVMNAYEDYVDEAILDELKSDLDLYRKISEEDRAEYKSTILKTLEKLRLELADYESKFRELGETIKHIKKKTCK